MAKKSKNSPVELIGKILKIVRDTKDVAQITVQIPARDSTIVPIGDVNLTIELIQREMKFGEPMDDEDTE